MKQTLLPLLILCLTLPFAYADEGMWLFSAAPKQQIYEKYGFQLTDEWLEHVQKSTARFGRGGSASFVSPQGLIFTNHHVGARFISQLSTPENDLLANGFHARTLEEELPVSGLEVLVTVFAKDVTERVNAKIVPSPSGGGLGWGAGGTLAPNSPHPNPLPEGEGTLMGSLPGGEGTLMPPEEAQRLRNAAIAEIEREYTESTGLRCEVTTLFQGGMFYLYGYKVYNDIRLVWAPEESIGAFGGDPDNFEFPRFCVDAAFFRAYEDGKPAQIEHYLKWNFDGVQEGELVFIAGFPGRTERSFTREHLEFQRDVFFPWRLQKLFRREVMYYTFGSMSAENHRRIAGDLTRVRNHRKRAVGQLQALLTPELWREDIPSFRAQLQGERRLILRFGQSPDTPEWRIMRALDAARVNSLYLAYDLYELGEAFNSQTFRIARNIVRLATELEKPNEERLPEFRDDRIESVRASILSSAPIYEDVEIMMMTDSLTMLVEMQSYLWLLEGLPIVKMWSPRETAMALIRGSKLRDAEERRRLLDGGIAAIEASDDTMILFALQHDPSARGARKMYEELVEAPLTAAYAELAQQRFERYGTSVYPDATFTLRLSYGTVKGYTDSDGNDIPAFTTIGGLFDRAELQGFRPPWLPAQTWMDATDTLDMTVPFNFVSTLDTIGGNSGSPVVNTRGEVIGTHFDGNRYRFPNIFVYCDERGRAIAVHAAVVVETLRKINRDERILAELGWQE